jgi:hypothetical protein
MITNRIRPLVKTILLLLCVFSITACGIKYNVRGRVVEAETGKPVEGGAVAIRWGTYHIMPRMLGLSSGWETIAEYETLTDAEGYFDITGNLFREYHLGVYKKGFICWDSDTVFIPEGKDFKEMFVPREDFSFGRGMEIKLEPFKEGYPEYAHAHFTINVKTKSGTGLIFSKAIHPERLVIDKKIRERKEKERKQK